MECKEKEDRCALCGANGFSPMMNTVGVRRLCDA